MGRTSTPWRNAFCLLLVTAALLLRAGVPHGWMLGEGQQGGIAITLCNSDATVTIPMKPDHRPSQDNADGKDRACAFSAHQSAATPPDGLAPLPLPQLAEAAYDATRAAALDPDTPRVLPPATGPPALA